jgi:3-oxoacyl-[acyl-carrier protein] reductase
VAGMRELRLFAPGAVAVITGAAGGLGAAIVDAFLSAGCRVLAVDISSHGLTRLAARHPGISTLVADLTADDAPSEVAEAAVRAHGGLHVLVNNAGITRHGSALEFPRHEWDRVMDINLRAPFLLSQASARVMSGGGSIVNIGSIGGRTANPGNVPYGVSKTALLGLTQHLALEWGPLGIRVNAVNPGMTTSSMNGLVVPDAVKAAQSDLVPLRRLPDPSDVADAVVFLASARARSITGTVVDVDGGYLLSLMSTLPRGEMRPGSAST